MNRSARTSRRGHAGVTLFEVLVATVILAMLAVMIGSAFQHTANVRERLGGRQERDHLARIALGKITRDLRSAFLSAHANPEQMFVASRTAFVGRDSSPGDRIDMTTFTHRRLQRGVHEGDACEVGYRVEDRRSANRTTYDLLRRESARIDADPLRGGNVDVLVPDVISFNLRYYDQSQDRWLDGWDTTQAAGQGGRLPTRVKIELVLRDEDRGRRIGPNERKYMTETPLLITEVLRFGLPIFN